MAVTSRATNGSKDALTFADRLVNSHPADWREKAHEGLEIVDPSATGRRIANVFGIGNRIATVHLCLSDPERSLLRKQVVGDSHFVPVGIRGK